MYSKEIVNCCINKLDLGHTKLDIGHYYSSLPLCIVDAVFSIGIKYTATRNTVERFSKYLYIMLGSSYRQKDDMVICKC